MPWWGWMLVGALLLAGVIGFFWVIFAVKMSREM